jgi:protein TonB
LRRVDLVTAGLALAVHAGFAFAVIRGGGDKPAAPKPKPVLLDFSKKKEEPPPVAAAKAPSAPEATKAERPVTARAPKVRKVAMRTPAPPSSRPAAAPADAPKASAAPVYAVAMASPTGTGAAVAVNGTPGGTGPGGNGTGASGPLNGGGAGKEGPYRPASAREVGSMPEVDVDACGRAAKYPKEAELAGTEGDVRVRVALTERGKVHAVKVLSSPGKGLDQAAIDALKNRCKFKPAVDHSGQAVAYVIENYTFHFQLPR